MARRRRLIYTIGRDDDGVLYFDATEVGRMRYLWSFLVSKLGRGS